MSAQAWALVGVALGAVLGGGAQIVANLVQDKAARKKRQKEVWHAAYSALMSSVMDVITATEHLRSDFHSGLKVTTEHQQRMLGAQQRLMVADADVRLVAPRDTAEAARAVVLHLGASMNNLSDRAKDEATHVDQIEAFVALAKRDLDVDK
ncbi:hypothetical protein [Nocardioides mangrovi]|uniref:Uncharacterized protein n=1 Tax=Nocardioides mangrovi TaxID=2874580 RepID=A0ABS7U7U5_9ACTN|nr:hypothetical protein [Nocardioides mangrovi]MBZ5736927.1 hypothetical protein [Nocardioides mangrovi]